MCDNIALKLVRKMFGYVHTIAYFYISYARSITEILTKQTKMTTNEVSLQSKLAEGMPFIKQSNSEGLVKQTNELIVIDNYSNIPTIKCPPEVQVALRFVGFKGITDYIFNY
tara:strand:- start:4185 stop:4520 length:336 start_codon:yes stop_codon:yes gene_type:complete